MLSASRSRFSAFAPLSPIRTSLVVRSFNQYQ
jgi:hypothetical protein